MRGLRQPKRQLERRIARTPTTSPRAATTAAPSTPCSDDVGREGAGEERAHRVDDVRHRVERRDDLEPARRPVDRQQHAGGEQGREQQRLLDGPEHPVLALRRQRQRERQRADPDAEERQHQRRHEHAAEVQVEAERRHDRDDDRDLHQHRHDLLERAADQQRRTAERRDQLALVRAGLHLLHQVGAGERRAHQRGHRDDAGHEPLQRRRRRPSRGAAARRGRGRPAAGSSRRPPPSARARRA